jgi:hypothetical protein
VERINGTVRLGNIEAQFEGDQVRLANNSPLRPIWLTNAQLKAIVAEAESRWSK